MSRKQYTNKKVTLVFLAGFIAFLSCSDTKTTTKTASLTCGLTKALRDNGDIIIGTILEDDISVNACQAQAAIALALEQMNVAGGINGQKFGLVNKRPNIGENFDFNLLQENVKELHDKQKAVAIISHLSSFAVLINEITSMPAYENLVQCNYTATSPSINDPTMDKADKNDTLYRTIVHDEFQSKIMAQIILNEGYSELGIYYIDDPYGNGLVNALTQLKQPNQLLEDVNFVIQRSFPNKGVFDLSSNQTDLIEIIDANIDALILIVTSAQASAVLKYFIDNNYSGGLILSDGGHVTEIFEIVKGIDTWMSLGTNKLIGTNHDYYGGINSNEFKNIFKNKFNEEATGATSAAFDCARMLGLALLYAGNKDRYTAKDIKDNIVNFKENNQNSESIYIGISIAEFKNARKVIANNKIINYEGASENIIWDMNGDRIEQGMTTFTINSSGDGWVDTPFLIQ